MAGTRRRSYEAGHRPKFMVVLDGSAECAQAVHFAARRAARLGARMLLLAVAEPPDDFEWVGVGATLREEARAEAEGWLDAATEAARAAGADRAASGAEPEAVLREGARVEEILALIAADEDVSFVVLAAGTPRDGANPLLPGLAARAASFPVPIVIVPGGLSLAEIEALAG